jgi:hypothetical protein
MAKETFLVEKFDKRTGKSIETVLSTVNENEAKEANVKYNDDRTIEQRDEIEYRLRSGDPSYKIKIGS